MPRPAATSAFDSLEAAWADVYTAYGEHVVAESRGVRPSDDRYPRLRRAFAAALTAIDRAGLSAVEAAGLATIESALVYIDDTIWLDGLERTRPADVDALRRTTYEAFGAAAADVRIGIESVDRLTAMRRQATAADPAERRAAFEALAPLWAAVDGDGGSASPYGRLIRDAAARADRDGSVIDANAAVLGLAPGTLEPMLTTMLERGRRLLASVVDAGPIEPWDYRYLTGAAERALGNAIPRDRLLDINAVHLRALGADPDPLRIVYDILPAAGRPLIPVAFTIGVGIPARPYVFATYETGGLGNVHELLHESGHAIHYAAIRTRPCFAEPPSDHAAFVEAIGDVVGWDAGEPAFQEHHLGRSVDRATSRLDRYGGVLLDVCWALFEIELLRAPDRRPNDVWTEITREGLGIAAHPEWSWWAVRGQLVELPGYMANYALAAIAAAALRARLHEVRGDWSRGDPGWYPYVAERLLRFGGEVVPSSLIEAFLGTPLDATAVLADMAPSGA